MCLEEILRQIYTFKLVIAIPANWHLSKVIFMSYTPANAYFVSMCQFNVSIVLTHWHKENMSIQLQRTATTRLNEVRRSRGTNSLCCISQTCFAFALHLHIQICTGISIEANVIFRLFVYCWLADFRRVWEVGVLMSLLRKNLTTLYKRSRVRLNPWKRLSLAFKCWIF